MDMKELNALLAIIKDSERLIVGLKVSIGSPSSELRLIENGIIPFLSTKKRTLKIQIFLFAFRAVWLRIINWRKRPRIW